MREIIKNEKTEREKNEMIKLDLIQSRRFGRICYGFGRDENGLVYVKEEESNTVKMIFAMAINGHSLQDIQSELFNKGIKSPSGKDKWTRDVIDKTINNKNMYHLSFRLKTILWLEEKRNCVADMTEI